MELIRTLQQVGSDLSVTPETHSCPAWQHSCTHHSAGVSLLAWHLCRGSELARSADQFLRWDVPRKRRRNIALQWKPAKSCRVFVGKHHLQQSQRQGHSLSSWAHACEDMPWLHMRSVSIMLSVAHSQSHGPMWIIQKAQRLGRWHNQAFGEVWPSQKSIRGGLGVSGYTHFPFLAMIICRVIQLSECNALWKTPWYSTYAWEAVMSESHSFFLEIQCLPQSISNAGIWHLCILSELHP